MTASRRSRRTCEPRRSLGGGIGTDGVAADAGGAAVVVGALGPRARGAGGADASRARPAARRCGRGSDRAHGVLLRGRGARGRCVARRTVGSRRRDRGAGRPRAGHPGGAGTSPMDGSASSSDG